jgi:DNA replication protein DnaC
MDELGMTRDPTNFISDSIGRLVESRLGKWTVWCTNLKVGEIQERMDGRIASRLIRDENKVISIKAGDYALRQRKSA